MAPGKGFKPRTIALKANSFKKSARKEDGAIAKLRQKAMKAKRPSATAEERAHMGKVAALGCILCQHLGFGPTPAEVHHARERHGWGRSGHFATMPLCPFHHTGQPGGVHSMGREEFTERYGISEMDLLQVVRIRLGLDFVKPKGGDRPSVEQGPSPIKLNMENDLSMSILPEVAPQQFGEAQGQVMP